jgi:hypothetical protein
MKGQRQSKKVIDRFHKEEKMKNKYILILVTTTVLLLISTLAFLKWQQVMTTEKFEEEYTQISSFFVDEVVQIDLKTSETLFLVKENEWKEQNKSHVYNQEAIWQIVDTLSTMTAFASIKNVQEYEVYGITEEAKLVTVYTKDGQVQTFRIGIKTPNGEGYYIKTNEDSIYIVLAEEIQRILRNRSELIEATINIPKEQHSVTIKRNKEDLLALAKNGASKIWQIGTPYRDMYVANEEEISTYLKLLQNLSFSHFVSDDKDKYREYGLQEPLMEIHLNNNWELSIGNKQNGFFYAMQTGDENIYAIDEKSIEKIFGFDAFAMLRKEVYKVDKDILQLIEISYNNQVKTLKINEVEFDVNESIENKDAENKDIENEAMQNKEEQQLENYEEILQKLSEIRIHTVLANPEIEQRQQRPADITIKYVKLDGEEIVLELIPYDPTYYILRYNEQTEFAIERRPILEILNLF